MTPDQATPSSPQGSAAAAQPRARAVEGGHPVELSLAPQSSSRLRLIATEEARAHEQARLIEQAMAALSALTEPISIAADATRSTLQKFLQTHVHTLHARPSGSGFGFNQQRSEDRVSVEPLIRMCADQTKRLERHIRRIEPGDQFALMARAKAIGFQSGLEKFALFVHERADESGTVSKGELRDILHNCVDFKIAAAQLRQEMAAVQIGLEGEGQPPPDIGGFEPSEHQARGPQGKPRAVVPEESETDAADDDDAA